LLGRLRRLDVQACERDLPRPDPLTCYGEEYAELWTNAQGLHQQDFDSGTKIIAAARIYKLCQDMTFAPGKPGISASNEVIANAFDPVAVKAARMTTTNFCLASSPHSPYELCTCKIFS